ncbi:Branched-chain amino acid ABC transporter ATP-binding protein LivF [Geoglobus acetivorans]|uniref:Branched-chain amino acid ABC transporter ATP-binding protein LivF n=1 Tax=Geoglobus acetivorans TaxID=565033 RepID=A0A0A7GCV0_GEOAI|nr:Branched-chain amino acid ABC transporter ATP-binding protein LivF [Geoglobus acetivorans]
MLEVRNLNSYYGKAHVLHDVSLHVDRGETLAVLGPNGAGKTTLLNSICGMVKTEGEILFKDREISSLKPYRRIKLGMGVCPEGRKLFPDMTVEDNLLLGAGNGNAKEQLEFVYDLFPRIKELKNNVVKNMSGGEQQMVAIGRALMSNPELLLLDEPSMGLAPIILGKIMEALKRIREETEISILLVEQNVHLALQLADRVSVLVKGEIVSEGKAEEMVDLEKHYFEL